MHTFNYDKSINNDVNCKSQFPFQFTQEALQTLSVLMGDLLVSS